jgi:hypothetical protein
MLDAPFIISCGIVHFLLFIASFRFARRVVGSTSGYRFLRLNKKMAVQNSVIPINCKYSDNLIDAIQCKMMGSRSCESLVNSRGLAEPIVHADYNGRFGNEPPLNAAVGIMINCGCIQVTSMPVSFSIFSS